MDFGISHHGGVDLEDGENGVDGIKNRFFVLLHIPVVGERQAFEEGEEGREISDEASAFASGEFGNVRIFLLGHQ